MRKLVYIRIVHTAADMGSLSEKLQEEIVSRIGKEKWEENQRRIQEFWNELEKSSSSLNSTLNIRRSIRTDFRAEEKWA
ncbi:MAG: hypothetical protein NHB15_17770 [Methanosarcina barkeri]|nr:hypothetical protein [Methanosarcina sp. ERenArc_MAG2]